MSGRQPTDAGGQEMERGRTHTARCASRGQLVEPEPVPVDDDLVDDEDDESDDEDDESEPDDEPDVEPDDDPVDDSPVAVDELVAELLEPRLSVL
jgi:hypothetical protein